MTDRFELSEKAIVGLASSGIPSHMRGGILRFFNDRIPPGHFLSAVINNDLREAVSRADDTNKHCLPNYIEWLYSHAPAGSWGHGDAVRDWLK